MHGRCAAAAAAAGFKDSVIGTPYAFSYIFVHSFVSGRYLNRLHNWPNAIQTVFVVGPAAFAFVLLLLCMVVCVCVWTCVECRMCWVRHALPALLCNPIAAGETICLFRVSLFLLVSRTLTWMGTSSCRCVVRNMLVCRNWTEQRKAGRNNENEIKMKICPEYARAHALARATIYTLWSVCLYSLMWYGLVARS